MTMLQDSSTVSTHSRLKAAGTVDLVVVLPVWVSTHSRLKAAGQGEWGATPSLFGFNTQPPEGGWRLRLAELHPPD